MVELAHAVILGSGELIVGVAVAKLIKGVALSALFAAHCAVNGALVPGVVIVAMVI